MQILFKQRFIGALVLLALIGLLLPFLLHNNPEQEASPDAIPSPNAHAAAPSEPPATDNKPEASLDIPVPSLDISNPEPKKEAAATAADSNPSEDLAANMQSPQAPIESSQTDTREPSILEAAPPETPKTQEANVTALADTHMPQVAGWAVQMGAFKKEKRAQALVEKLQKEGFTVFAVEGKNDGLIRVYVGPEENKTKAKHLRDRVNQQTKQHGVLVAYKGA